MGDLPAVPAAASPQVPSMRLCREADDEVGNHSVSMLVLLIQRVCWPDEYESSETSVATGQER